MTQCSFIRKNGLPCFMSAKDCGLCGVHIRYGVSKGYTSFALEQLYIKHKQQLSDLRRQFLDSVTPDDDCYDEVIEQLQLAENNMREQHVVEIFEIKNNIN